MPVATCYNLTKTGIMIALPEGMPRPGPYYPSLVDMSGLEDFPYHWALYFSTDHLPGLGGVWLYVTNGDPTDAASWVSYDDAAELGMFDHVAGRPAANPIFQDPVQGNGHTETAHANVIDGTLYMSYHKNGIPPSQATLMATSTDGITFARINGAADSVILRYDVKTSLGDGHTGYFRWAANPFAGIKERYIGYSLHGGTDAYYSALWASDDAKAWHRLAILVPIEGQAIDHPDRMLIWHDLDPASIRRLDNGEYVALCVVGNRASGRVARINEMYEVYLAADGVTLTRQAQRLLGVGAPDTKDSEEVGGITMTTIDGQVHLLYVGASEDGELNTVMAATGTLSTATPTSPLLTGDEGTRHIRKP